MLEYEYATSTTSGLSQTVFGDGCVTRTYGYDDRTNRTGSASFGPATDGACGEGTATSTQSHGYDTADRLTDDGYGDHGLEVEPLWR